MCMYIYIYIYYTNYTMIIIGVRTKAGPVLGAAEAEAGDAEDYGQFS